MSRPPATHVDARGRVCTACDEYKLWREYVLHTKDTTGHQSRCKSCSRPQMRELMAARRQRNREVIQQAKDRPCMDCGNSYPSYVMDFDHVRGKKLYEIGSSIGCMNAQQLLAEIAKCEVVCANCHRMRTHTRKQGVKLWSAKEAVVQSITTKRRPPAVPGV